MNAPTILLVEDDEDLRQLAATVLADDGYSVLCAANADEALRLLAATPSIELLFTDIVMPGALDGFALARAAVARRPDLKVLYTTGYSRMVGPDDVSAPLLRKPYRPSQVLQQLARMLGNVPSSPAEC